jgi:Pyridine nucleotide-disulphide oxidoreductase, dimerisation domain
MGACDAVVVGGGTAGTHLPTLSETTRWLGQDDPGGIELRQQDGVLVGAVAVGPDAAAWMAEATLAIRARISVTVLADVVQTFPTYGEALETAVRELARTAGRRADQEDGLLSELETPEGDAIEQDQEVVADDDVSEARRERPFDVDEADAAEQERSVGFDDDDYR